MDSSDPLATQIQIDAMLRHGLLESGPKNGLRDLTHLSAAFCGASAVLVLRDETGIWYQDSWGLSAGQMLSLEAALAQSASLQMSGIQLKIQGLCIIASLPLTDSKHLVIGTLYLVSPNHFDLSAIQREGLRQLICQMEAFLALQQQGHESRAIPRSPAATSFVPGLAHELRNFIFGISATLDTFQAHFADHDEVSKYGTVIRRSLDRLNAFIEELLEYGKPQLLSWSVGDLKPLLREAVEYHRSLATRNNVDLQLQITGSIPPLNTDKQSLCKAFILLIDLALQQEEAGGRVVLHVATRIQGERTVIYGHLDGAGLKLQDVDLTRLFEPFYFRASGLGRLALPVARRIFESHGGSLTAAPGPEGGMRMSFALPAVAVC